MGSVSGARLVWIFYRAETAGECFEGLMNLNLKFLRGLIQEIWASGF